MNFEFTSRRSTLYGQRGMVASSQPLASAAGLDALRKGSNAASAAVAMAAALNVTEPTSTGLGGDAFILYFNAKDKQIYALNGSGRCPAGLSLDRLQSEGLHSIPPYHPYTITVPGACAAWSDFNERFGNLSLKEVFSYAIDLATGGFPVSPITAYFWNIAASRQLSSALNGSDLLINGKAPEAGQIFQNRGLARTLELIAANGKQAFYDGDIADAIVQVVRAAGGCLQKTDLMEHQSTWEEPISIEFAGRRIWECPPNGQGLAALLALNILKHTDLHTSKVLSSERYHLEIEAMRLAFSDAFYYVADPLTNPAPIDFLLSENYARERAGLISPKSRNEKIQHGVPIAHSDTVYFCVADQWGNACSFINSNYMGFGTGIVPSGYGFSLQNRGHNFSLDPAHPNHLAPRKRPYHTIIPAMITDDLTGDLVGPFGVMGGFMQPQGHLQVAISLLIDNLNPQECLDLPRFCIQPELSGKVAIEDGVSTSLLKNLEEKGHPVKRITGIDRSLFGRGQLIIRDNTNGVYAGASDPRADGCAMTL